MFWKKGRGKTFKKITLGICAMDKKAQSKPMREILSRLPEDMFEVIVFGDNCIFNQGVETWPVVEVLITFYSTRFPTEKALEYIKLRKPFLINDLAMDPILKDRRNVYELLESIGIDVPNHVFVMRKDGEEEKNVIEEFDEVKKNSFFLSYFMLR